MSSDKPLVAVFIPPLASLLARAEQLKGEPLTEREVLAIRDQSVCMMMPIEEKVQMAASRGYRDVEPENCWADWHRLQVEMTGRGFLPKLCICVLGGADLAKDCAHLLQGVEHEISGPDPRMLRSFEASQCRVRPSLTDLDMQAVGTHQTVLYVLSRNVTSQEAPSECRAFLRLGRSLLEAGGVAMKCESSGIAHARSRWMTLGARADDITALYEAFVQLPLKTATDYQTCGLHLLGQPDLIMSAAGAETVWRGDVTQVVRYFDALALYLLTEATEKGLAAGHTFRPDAESPRFTLHWEPCRGYPEDDFFFNPFGRWRLRAPARPGSG